jgi:hypothetical protein
MRHEVACSMALSDAVVPRWTPSLMRTSKRADCSSEMSLGNLVCDESVRANIGVSL